MGKRVDVLTGKGIVCMALWSLIKAPVYSTFQNLPSQSGETNTLLGT